MSKTRMHSSRMRTVCSSSHLLGGEMSAPGRCVCSWGFCSGGSAPGGVSAPRWGGCSLGGLLLVGGLLPGGVCSGEVSAPGVQCQSDPP